MRNWQKVKQNPALWEKYLVKEKVIRAIRKFFEKRNYHELESPILAQALPQEHYLNPLTTTLDFKDRDSKSLYLIPSTERYNKMALAAGLGEHFVITKVFRGLEDFSPNHSPEFTMLEWYHLNANYFDLMDDCKKLFNFINDSLNQNNNGFLEYQGLKIHLKGNWEKYDLSELLKKYSNIDLKDIEKEEDFRKAMLQKGYNITKNDDWEIMFELLFANEIEIHLKPNIPTFVYNYPYQVCPLTKRNNENPLVCEKVELYLAGMELGNGYTELISAKAQYENFKREEKARELLNKPAIAFDHELVDAIASGLPDVAGIGMGLDRLVMLFANAKNINDINLFPGIEHINEYEKQ